MISVLNERLAALLGRLGWRLISAPIYVKVFGIGLLISLLFACLAFYFMRSSMFEAHYRMHGEKALSVAVSLALRLDSGDIAKKSALDEDVNRTLQVFPDVRYILVQDAHGRILSHGLTFPHEAPPDIMERNMDLCAACHRGVSPIVLSDDLLEARPNLVLPDASLRAYRRAEGLVLEVTAPIGDGRAGSVRLGVGDKTITRDLESVNRSIAAGMILCLFATVCSALLLTYVLNKPIHALLEATKAVAEGDFSRRAPVYSDDELGRLAVAFNRMTERLAESRQRVLHSDRLASIGEFAAGVAHEINNPLDGVMSCLARLQRDPTNISQNMEYLEMIQHALKRVSGVIQRLLEYSHAREMNVQPEDIPAIVENVVALIRIMAHQGAIDIQLDLSEAPPVMCDRYHLEQALLNLALNGLAAIETRRAGTDSTENTVGGPSKKTCGALTFRAFTVTTAEGLKRVQIDVADTGTGIAPENISRVFDAFFTTKEPGKGTGLGLAIVKEIIEAHSGNISVESVLGAGTVFHVVLPAGPIAQEKTTTFGVIDA